jgi:hypothetical protein
VILLTIEERRAPEGLADSRKSEGGSTIERISCFWVCLTWIRARSRERWVHAGPVSKWRVRYGSDRMSGISETGNRGPERKYDSEYGQRILALLDQPSPEG